MLVLLGTLALAQVPPDIDLDDLDKWEDESARVLEGPAGCWEMVGHASWNWDAGRFGATRGDMVFVGRLIDGVWQEFHLEPLGEVARARKEVERRVYVYEPRFVPLFGRLKGDIVVSNERGETRIGETEDPSDEDGEDRRRRRRRRSSGEESSSDSSSSSEPTNLVREIMDEISGSADSSWAKWDSTQQAVLLERRIPLGDGAKVPVANETTVMPNGGPAVAMDLILPQTFYRGTFPRFRISDASVRVRTRPSNGELFPTLESYRAEFGVFGFTVSGAQTIRYKSARRCAVTALKPSGPESTEPDAP